MAGELLLASQFAAAALMFALAGALLYLNFGSRLNRVFALFLVLRAMVIVTNRVPALVPDARLLDYFLRTSPYFLIGAGMTLAYFAAIYPRAPTWPSRRVILATALALTLIAEVAYAIDHCLVVCTTATGDAVGPLVGFASLLPVVSGLAAWRIARQARDGGPGSAALRTVALGFAVTAAVDGALSVGVVFVARDLAAGFSGGMWAYVPHLVRGAAVLPLAGYLAESLTLPRRRLAATLAFVVAAGATGILVGAGMSGAFGIFLLGIWRLVLALTVAYALVKHSLFDLDARVRFTIRQSTIGAVFVIVFFVVSEVGEELVSTTVGGVLGGVAAFLLVFALVPLQHFAEKLARAALPRPPPGRDLPLATRQDIYREQLALCRVDGELDRSERHVLEKLREALALSDEQARAIENELT